jgi:hypothetical protein
MGLTSTNASLLAVLADLLVEILISPKASNYKNHLHEQSDEEAGTATAVLSRTFGLDWPFFRIDATCPSINSRVLLTHGSNISFI